VEPHQHSDRTLAAGPCDLYRRRPIPGPCADPRAQGREDARPGPITSNRHGARRFDMAGLPNIPVSDWSKGPPASVHRTNDIIVEAQSTAPKIANVRFMPGNSARYSGRGVPMACWLCQAEDAGALRAFVESCRYPAPSLGGSIYICPARCSGSGGAGVRRFGSDAARHGRWWIGTHAWTRLGLEWRGADLGDLGGGVPQRCDPWARSTTQTASCSLGASSRAP